MKTLILGAGIAGLAASIGLRKHGIDALILEARDRVGGRILTQRDRGIPVELGAEFVHGKPISPLRRLALDKVAAQQHPPAADSNADIETSLARVLRDASKRASDVSFAALLRAHDELDANAKRALVEFVDGFNAADAEIISVKGLAAQTTGASRIARVAAGYDALVEQLRLDAGPVRLGAVVTSIAWQPGRVAVTLRDGEILDAERLVCTLPLALLQRRTPRFEPPLVDKEPALRVLHQGEARRMTLRFCADVFAPERGIVQARRAGYAVFWARAPSLVVAWAGGPHARALAALSHEARIADAVEGLASALATRLTIADVEAAHAHDWSADPFSGGAYSYVGVDGEDAPAALAAPLADTIYFAGEATQYETIGTVNGAYDSGVLAAERLAAALSARRL